MTTKVGLCTFFPGFKNLINVLIYIMVIACGCQAATLSNTPTGTFTPTNTATQTPVVSSVWRVDAGGSLYPDSYGNTWSADTNFNTGTAHSVTNTVSNTNDSLLYQSERYGNTFVYSFNVPAGSYQVTCKFAELFWTVSGSRVFNVSINGTQVLTDFDIYADTGAEYRAVSKVFNNILPAGGLITAQFGPASADNSQVCAIQINPMPATPTPTETPCTTAVIVPYLQVNTGAWQQTNNVTVVSGSTVTLGPQPLTGGTWNWTGPNGFTSAARELAGIPLSQGSNSFTATYINDCASQDTEIFTILVITPTPGITTVSAGCADNIVVDGVINESVWNSVGWNSISKLAAGSNPQNVSGKFKILWNTDSLFVGLSINDSYMNATQVACANYNDSAVEIYLDMINDQGAQPFPGSVGDFHFMISYDCLQFCLNAAVAMPPSGLQYASIYNTSGYTMEVKIPWTLLGTAPVIGASYGFDVQTDYNNGTNTRVGQLVWTGDTNDWKSSANFGIVQLGFCPSPTATITPIPPGLAESYHVFPNPINPKQSPAHIKYYIANDSEISIKIFTINGNLVQNVLNKVLKSAGQHSEDTWDAVNKSGHEVMSGTYLCVLEVNDKKTGTAYKFVKKLVVLR
jgi:hypothetical protein